MSNAMILKGSLTAVAIAAVVAAASAAIPSRADARAYRAHHYGRAFVGAYDYAPRGHFAYPRVHMYAADRYHQRPLIGGSRVNNNFNPDFQFGGAYGQ
jgi:hypothetical protein